MKVRFTPEITSELQSYFYAGAQLLVTTNLVWFMRSWRQFMSYDIARYVYRSIHCCSPNPNGETSVL